MKGKTSALAPFVKSITMTRTEARRLPIGDLEKLVASLDKTLAAEKTKLEKKQSQERSATIKKVNALLAESGLQPNDLKKTTVKTKGQAKAKINTKAKTKAKAKTPKAASKAAAKGKPAAAKKAGKRATVPPRYRLELDGQEHLWSGRGRTPKVFQAYFDAGNSRESCEIST
ncbi:H-NS histone family protein [Haliea sp. E1-2-M8]|uniref:H-NS histone family protein n=1 Tax=Haliea sp. E1-2-M8 TaxID=3064706 RepID=UPI00271C9703|nr:H-NS histone family protein [Haliea sp. E1-2-M8]MDO8863814.1 H-NS histone family protein [Haliea sp. E1-2-M8]